MTEELKLVLEMFSKMTDGALIGGITWMILDLVKAMVPWGVWLVLGTELLDKLPKFKITKKG